LSFDFFPNLPTVSNNALPEYVNRCIVDIREHSEVEICIPYTANTLYTDIANNIGTLTVRVIDPLVAPATVSSAITILCEVAGGSDMEFFGPRFASTPQGIVPQSGLSEDCKIYSHTIGNTQIAANPTLASSAGPGEKISSFRSLIKRFTPLRTNTVGTTTDSFGITVLCDALPVRSSSASLSYIESDFYGCIASFYAIVGGGVRFRDVISNSRLTKTGSPTQAFYQISNTPAVTSIISAVGTPLAADMMNNSIVQETQHNSVITVEIPQYSNYIAKASSDLIMEEGAAILKYNPNSTLGTGNTNVLKVVVSANNGPLLVSTINPTLHTLHRSGADDSNFYCFVSVPPLVQNSLVSWSAGF